MNDGNPASARFIVPVWGRPFLDNFLAITLPAILASGNLPAIAETYPTTLVLLTESRYRDEVEAHPAIAALSAHCAFELREIDDLVVDRNMYGMSLTHAFHRGFADLGAAMCDSVLFFLNADFVLSAGAGQRMLEGLRAGHRAVLAPSYCVTTETVAGELLARVEDGRLSVAPRDMARLALAHRHDTVAARTVSDARFHLPVTDQFYFEAGANALVGRQFPMAMLAMRPAVAYLEPVSFWDYAALSMACPGEDGLVIADSDEIAMLELREANYATGDLLSGPVDPDAAGAVLGGIATAGHRRLGRRPLVLHADDLGPAHAAADAALKDVVARVVAAMPDTPMPVEEHPLWTSRVSRFARARDGAFDGHDEASGARALYNFLFGRVPGVRPWHPLRSLYRPLLDLLAELAVGPGAKVLAIGGSERMLGRVLAARGCVIQTIPAHEWEERRESGADRVFDACVIELSRREMQRLPRILGAVRQALRPGATLIVSHVDWRGDRRGVPVDMTDLRAALAPGDDMVWVAWCDPAAARLVRDYSDGLERGRSLSPIARALATFVRLLVLVPRSLTVHRTAPEKFDPDSAGRFYAVCGIIRIATGGDEPNL